MYYEVYLDFYFLENLFTDCVLLYLTAMVLRCTAVSYTHLTLPTNMTV